jgi:hypothetical protein
MTSTAGTYPVRFAVDLPDRYNRWGVCFRLLLVLPHVVILFFLELVRLAVTVVAWFAILCTGRYPPGLLRFSVGVSRWTTRVTAYVLLYVDHYPLRTCSLAWCAAAARQSLLGAGRADRPRRVDQAAARIDGAHASGP